MPCCECHHSNSRCTACQSMPVGLHTLVCSRAPAGAGAGSPAARRAAARRPRSDSWGHAGAVNASLLQTRLSPAPWSSIALSNQRAVGCPRVWSQRGDRAPCARQHQHQPVVSAIGPLICQGTQCNCETRFCPPVRQAWATHTRSPAAGSAVQHARWQWQPEWSEARLTSSRLVRAASGGSGCMQRWCGSS